MRVLMMNSKTLTEKIPYRRTVWVTGFLKTTISSSLITTGVLFLFTGITDHPLLQGMPEISIIVGALMILLAIIIVVIIDNWKEHKKKEELEIIDKTINEKAEKIAERKILEAMSKLDK